MVSLGGEDTTTETKLNELKRESSYTMNTNEALMEIQVQKNSVLEAKLDKVRKSLPYQIEYAKGIYADDLWQAMEHRGLNQVEFAEKAAVAKQFLTKVFRGGNCTIETMGKLAFALNYRVNTHLTPCEVGCAWLHRISEAAPRPPERFMNLWTESGYQPSVIFPKKPECEKIAA